VFSDIETESVQLAKIAHAQNSRRSKMALLRDVCKAQLAGLFQLMPLLYHTYLLNIETLLASWHIIPLVAYFLFALYLFSYCLLLWLPLRAIV